MPLIFVAFVPDTPPVIPPVTVGADQLYSVLAGIIPFSPFVGVTVNNTPLQVIAVIAFTAAPGFNVIVIVNVEPVQLPDNGVTIYVAVWVELVGFVRVAVIFVAFVPDVPPVIPPVTAGADQLYNVPAGTIPLVPFVGVNVNNTLLQAKVVIAVTEAVGFTVTVTVNTAPVQLPVTGVII